jgi:long-subunit fatty acid transport protein
MSGFVWVITQRVMVIPYRRFGATYRSHFHGNISEETRFNLFRGGNLYSRIIRSDLDKQDKIL